MCVGISLALTFLMAYYTYATLTEYSLAQSLNGETLIIAQGAEMVSVLWPLLSLGVLLGVLMVLIFMKLKKVI